MKVDTFACDECGAQKKETNHWYMVRLLAATKPTIEIGEWDFLMEKDTSLAHLCGRECVIKILNHWCATRTIATKKEDSFAPQVL